MAQGMPLTTGQLLNYFKNNFLEDHALTPIHRKLTPPPPLRLSISACTTDAGLT